MQATSSVTAQRSSNPSTSLPPIYLKQGPRSEKAIDILEDTASSILLFSSEADVTQSTTSNKAETDALYLQIHKLRATSFVFGFATAMVLVAAYTKGIEQESKPYFFGLCSVLTAACLTLASRSIHLNRLLSTQTLS